MTKVRIDKDEWYPYYSIEDEWGVEVELSDEVIERVRRVLDEFSDLQRYLGYVVDHASGRQP